MTNTTAVIIYFLFAMVTAGCCISILSKKSKVVEEKIFIFLGLAVVGWTITYMIWDMVENPANLRLIYCLFYPFIACVPPALLLFVSRFYLVDRKLPKAVTVLLVVFPVLITAMSVTGNHHNLIFKTFEVLEVSPHREVFIEYGAGFWVHTAFCYTVTMAAAIMVVYFFFKTPKYNRFSLVLFAAGIVTTLVGNIFTLLHLFPVSFDPTVVLTNVSAAIYYYAVINNSKTIFINFSRDAVFDALTDYTLILDTGQNIVDMNQTARAFFAQHNLKPGNMQDILDKLAKHEYFLPEDEDNTWVDYAFCENGSTLIFNLQTTEVFNERKQLIGCIAMFREITQTRLLQEKLEKRAGIDALTGLNNRYAYNGASRRLSGSQYLPLSIVMCDLNGLKAVNDRFGHKAGDQMLVNAAAVLETLCPENSFLARIGGDEFVFLLPGTPNAEAQLFVERVQEEMAKHQRPYPLVMAMGCATKQHEAESFEEVLGRADANMYQNKAYLKSKQHGGG